MMRYLLILVSIIFSTSSSVLASSTVDEEENVPIPIMIGDKDNTHIFRTPIVIPIECWYYGSVNSICINPLVPIRDLEIRVQNMETGDMLIEEYESVSSILFIPFENTSGCYNIEFIVNKSQSLVGGFQVE